MQAGQANLLYQQKEIVHVVIQFGEVQLV
jgi:hypothetical protein